MFRKLLKNIATFAVIAGAIITPGVVAHADDLICQDFFFSIEAKGQECEIGRQDKYTSSYITMKCEEAEFAEACYSTWAENQNGERKSGNYTFYEGDWQAISNSVYEDGDRTAVMIARLIDDVYEGGAYFSGYWYSDSGIY